MSQEMPWFKCNPTEWLQSCADMESEEFGFYARIILFMYQRGGMAPFDEGKLRHIWNCSRQRARKVRDALLAAGRIERVGDELTQSRVKRELRIAKKIDEKLNENPQEISQKPDENPSKTGEIFSDKSLKTNEPAAQIPDTRLQIPDTRESLSPVGDTGSRERRELVLAEPDPPPESDVDFAVRVWREVCVPAGLADLRSVNAARRRAVPKRIEEHGREGWEEACRKLAASDHCRGRNDRGWKADFDFIALQPTKLTATLEGRYDNRTPTGGRRSGTRTDDNDQRRRQAAFELHQERRGRGDPHASSGPGQAGEFAPDLLGPPPRPH